jgi:hypothetical protein
MDTGPIGREARQAGAAAINPRAIAFGVMHLLAGA